MARGQMIVTGLKEIDRALRELEPKIGKKVIRQAMRKSMKPVKTAVEQNAPVGETGLLAASVKIRAAKKSRKSFGIDVTIGEKDWVGKTWYAAAVEYGTSRMEGRGFMRKAFDESGDEAKGIAIRSILEGLEREANRRS